MSTPTFFEPVLCRQQTRNQPEPEPPQSNTAPSTLEWPVTQESPHIKKRTKVWRHSQAGQCKADLWIYD